MEEREAEIDVKRVKTDEDFAGDCEEPMSRD